MSDYEENNQISGFNTMSFKYIEKHEPREYKAMMSNNGVVLCDKIEGSFLLLRYPSDLERLKKLLNEITMVETEL